MLVMFVSVSVCQYYMSRVLQIEHFLGMPYFSNVQEITCMLINEKGLIHMDGSSFFLIPFLP